MKKVSKALFASLLLLLINIPNSLFALVVNGATELHDQMYPELTVNGQANLTNVTILGDVTINGNAHFPHNVQINRTLRVHGTLHASWSNFNFVEIRGNAFLTQCNNQVPMQRLIVHGQAVLHGCLIQAGLIHGRLSSANSNFLGSLEVDGKEADFKNCVINSLLLKKPTEAHDQIVELVDTNILTSITFESGNGIVIEKGTSQVAGGVIGGKIYNNNPQQLMNPDTLANPQYIR